MALQMFSSQPYFIDISAYKYQYIAMPPTDWAKDGTKSKLKLSYIGTTNENKHWHLRDTKLFKGTGWNLNDTYKICKCGTRSYN